MKLTITGRPISKKNSRTFIRRGRMIVSLPSKAYKNFQTMALVQLEDCKKTFNTLLQVNYVFHMKGKMDTDADNMMAGINDILQTAGIIENDKLIVKGTYEKVSGCSDWQTDIEIIKA